MRKFSLVIQKRIYPIVLLVAVFLSVLPLTANAVPEASFYKAVTFTVKDSPLKIVAGDFNKDGRPDLAVNVSSSQKVYILLGNGNGTFSEGDQYITIPNLRDLCVGDFNNDSNPDLVVVGVGGPNICILLGNGNGSFEIKEKYTSGTSGRSHGVTTGYFNDDDNLDLAVTSYIDDKVYILLGKGDGTFQPFGNYTAGDYPMSICTSDFNGDGKADLAAANYESDNISVYMGNGDGSFQGTEDFSAGEHPSSIKAGDFNGDGKVDLAVGNPTGSGYNKISIFLGKGDGSFGDRKEYSAGVDPKSLAVGDFNEDGKSDLAVTNHLGVVTDRVYIFLGSGNGSFQTIIYNTDNAPDSVAVSDFNMDGRPDLALSDSSGMNFSIFINNFPGLRSLSVSEWALSPAFDPNVNNYIVDLPNTINELELTATMLGSTDLLTIDGEPQLNGVSKKIPVLTVGSKNITISVSNMSGGGTRTYTVTVNKAAVDQSNADLIMLKTSTGVMTPSFNPNVQDYSVKVDNNVATLNITAKPADPYATMTINGRSVGSGQQTEAVNLSPGDNLVPVVVRSGNGTITKTYNITIVRGLSGNARLQSLSVGSGTLDPAFDPMTVAYAVDSPDILHEIDITAVAQEPGAMLEVNGSQPVAGSITETIRLDQGANLIPVVNTAPDGHTQQCYVISVNGTVSDSDLGSLSVTPEGLDFNPAVTSYNMAVNSDVSQLTLNAAPHDPKALVLVNGSMLSGGSTSVNLSHGFNTIDVMVVAQDASTKTYTIFVTRDYPPVTWSPGSLTASAITAYGMTLTWPDALSDAGIASYEIYSGTELIAVMPGSTTSYNVAGLSPGTNYTFTVKAKDGGGNAGPDLTVTAATINDSSPSIDTAVLDAAIVGTAYNAALTASGGNDPYTWSSSGLPAGLSIDASSGIISGVPDAAGTSVVNITLTDSLGAATTKGYTLSVFYPAGTGRYIVTPVIDDTVYTVGATPDGIATMTVKNRVSGFIYFTVDISLTESHAGDETAVFVQLRNGMQIAINATIADFDTISRAKAAFNVRGGDIIKVYLVDDLNNSEGFNPTLLQ